ncbi:hypothetical protein KL905_002645 [Ogataea polymorpha]|uniref:F-box domain-containing protein n=2 Tax=Ogataea polymorpha TaxID=460523 RepID=A0A9P8NW97_9ASCO|nr:hypothetical protein KL908_001870 [Ogataea polymorpha]KAG7906749.1 hypothetical protein KL907_002389 [Ogataea polymorpha]KAG7921880.1 hypothetical protein KL905_002645 [Ogataea polymorpha]KAG7934737.1 hypothetical protein KL934_002663 [Ogataea polymorpha]KAH3660915.1 hypothetical protein OGATHE_005247 [Ogataea polymorpha]
MIDTLPSELVLQVCQNLHQSDCFHLMLCTKFLSQCCLKRLYQSIIVDDESLYLDQILEDSYYLRDICGVKVYSSRVKTSYGLKQLIRTLTETDLVCLVQRIEVNQDLGLLRHCIPRMTNLKCAQLPESGVLSAPGLRSLRTKKLEGFNYDLHELELTQSCKLTISDFKHLKKLSVTAIARNSLKQYRVPLSSLLNTNGHKLKLHELTIKSALIYPQEPQILLEALDFTKMRVLRLIDLFEYPTLSFPETDIKWEELRVSEFRQWMSRLSRLSEGIRLLQSTKTLLEALSPQVKGLKVLELHVCNFLADHGPQFISSITDLRTLKVNIPSQQCVDHDPDSRIRAYLESISLHSNLRHLVIESPPIEILLLEQYLSQMRNLKCLKLCVKSIEPARFISFIRNFPELEFLDVAFDPIPLKDIQEKYIVEALTHGPLQYAKFSSSIYDMSKGMIKGKHIMRWFDDKLINL